MNSEQDLIRKLMVSKQIMDKHNTMGRGQAQDTISSPMVDEFQPVSATYNIPQGLMEETQPQKSYNTEVPTEDRIKNSRLPDEIKQLMLEHPIQQPTMGVNTGTDKVFSGCNSSMSRTSLIQDGSVSSSDLPVFFSTASPARLSSIRARSKRYRTISICPLA